jgi:putative phage-type endonuclease
MQVREPAAGSEGLDTVIETLTDYHDRANWLAARASGIGASEVSALFGLSPWDSPYTLWRKKTGQAPPVDPESEEAEYLYWGQHLEVAIAGRYQLVTKRSLWTGGSPFCVAKHQNLDMLFCTPDRLVMAAPDIRQDEPGLLQLKNTAWFMADEWEDGPPPHVLIQVQTEMACTKAQWASVAALVGGSKFRYFDILANPAMQEEIELQVAAFWEMVESGTQPEIDGHRATTSMLKALHPMDNGGTVDLPASALAAVEDWLAAKAEVAAAKKANKGEKDAAENELRALIGAASYGRLPDGRVLTLLHTERHIEARDELFRTLRLESESARKKRKG